jgi:glycosyltransferase involved in cell wall biosynthesis
MPEIAGDASIQVNPHNVDSIKEGLIDMLSDKDILMKLRGCAEKRHLQFDWDITAKKTMDSLLDVLHSN